MTTPTDDPADDPRLLAAVREYQALLEAGKRPRRPEFLGRHPELAGALTDYLDGLELVCQAAGQAPPRQADEPVPAEPLGDFRIVRELGRGGMGVVYEAVQLSLGRRVALKVLPFAATLDPRRLQRFRTEAQAAALLHHSNIVPVFGVGCERGVHFYAMQLIEGQSLAALVRQLRGPAGDFDRTGSWAAAPGGEEGPGADETRSEFAAALSTQRTGRPGDYFRTLAELARQAAEALEYAHQFGIVHRDVKPGNLLVDTTGRLWVTDFGLAQMRDGTGLTQTGDLVGTLRYMSPEQATGQRTLPDPRTDVYALGATLYELATLAPIFPGQTPQELLNQICHHEPRPPRAVARALPAELETVILKAVSKAPQDRYPTARALADDLQRFLTDRPVLARRPTPWERAKKWARRHPSVVWGCVLILVLCVAGLLVSNRMISAEQDRTKAALAGERQRAEEAERRYRQAVQAVDLLVQVSEEDLADRPDLRAARRRLLETSLGYYQELLAQKADDPAAQAELATARDRVRRLLDELATLQGEFQHHLLRAEEVRNDLGLSDEQRRRVTELLRQWSDERFVAFQQQPQPTPERRREFFLELARRQEQNVAGLLSGPQLARLKQIDLQLRGPGVFQEPEVVAALQLTPEQRARIRDLDFGPWFGPPSGPPPGPPRGPGGPPFGRDPRTAVEAVLARLTPVQVQRWRELTGKPYTGPLPIFFGPPRPPGRGP